MMATEIIKVDASLAEKWAKRGVPFLSAPTVTCYKKSFRIYVEEYHRKKSFLTPKWSWVEQG